MFRNYLAAALRNLVRNKLYAAINIVGLAVGFAAAILIAIFVRDELSYDTWLPGYEQTYLVYSDIRAPGAQPIITEDTGAEIAGWLEQDVPQIEAAARLARRNSSLRAGEVESNEEIFWSDADIFEVLRLPVFMGNAASALAQPDSVVITRSTARKYFGRDNVVGERMELDREHTLNVTAVLEDYPSNTHFDVQVFVSGVSSYSLLSQADARPAPLAGTGNQTIGLTYIRTVSDNPLSDLKDTIQSALDLRIKAGAKGMYNFPVIPIADIHLNPARVGDMNGHGDRSTVYALAVIAGLVLGIACINFINLTTARSARRATEVGIRKVSGALRRNLIVQFITESFFFAVVALMLALCIVQYATPVFAAALDRSFAGIWADPLLLGALAAAVGVTTVLSGAYPSFILSAFRPARTLKGETARTPGSGFLRNALVVLQFSVLIGLVLTTIIVTRQAIFASGESLRLDKDQVLVMFSTCSDPLKEALISLPGVKGVACSRSVPTLPSGIQSTNTQPNGSAPMLWYTSVEPGFFDLYGLQPVAGRFLSLDRAADRITATATEDFTGVSNVVINETAARALGHQSSEAAVGQAMTCNHVLLLVPLAMSGKHACEIIGVVPDFVETSIREPIPPTVFSFTPRLNRLLSIKLDGAAIPETLQAIHGLWRELGDPRPINLMFMDERVEAGYRDVERQMQFLNFFAGVAILVAALGLFGLSAFTAEQRTKEIGIRKAMGASRADILRLLLWQFTKPVLWANVIAWPAAYFIMQRWLEGFAYHVDMELWVFVAASALALVIAVLTVIGHALMVSRARPVSALRYE